MKVNLEEVACLVIAVALFAGNVVLIGLIGPMTSEEHGVSRGYWHIFGTCVLSLLALVTVSKIPHSWWFQIVYEFTEEIEETDEDETTQGLCIQ